MNTKRLKEIRDQIYESVLYRKERQLSSKQVYLYERDLDFLNMLDAILEDEPKKIEHSDECAKVLNVRAFVVDCICRTQKEKHVCREDLNCCVEG